MVVILEILDVARGRENVAHEQAFSPSRVDGDDVGGKPLLFQPKERSSDNLSAANVCIDIAQVMMDGTVIVRLDVIAKEAQIGVDRRAST